MTEDLCPQCGKPLPAFNDTAPAWMRLHACVYVPKENEMKVTPEHQQEIDNAIAHLLITLAFLVPRGTQFGPQSDLGTAIIRLKAAWKAPYKANIDYLERVLDAYEKL